MDEFALHQFLFSLLCVLLVWSLTRWLCKSSGGRNSPPSPPKLPLIGNMHQLGTLPHHDLQALARKHGPLMLLHFGSVPTLIVSSADGAQEIMKTNDLVFSDRPDTSLGRRLLYNNKDIAAAPYGEYWRQLKSISVLQLLSNRRVQSFHPIREEETALLVEKIRKFSLSGLPVNLSEAYTSLTNDVVCRAAFGKKYSEGKDGKKFLLLLREFLELLGTISIGDFIPWLSWINRVTGFDARVDRVAKELDEFLEGVIQEHMGGEKGKGAENFVDILLGIYRDQTAGMSIEKDSIKAILADVFAAGTDTTATVLEWAMTELLRHPTVMKKLQDEVRGVLNGKQGITNNNLEKMPYLKAVIKETLRYHVPIPLLVAHVARKDAKIKGYDIAAGTHVMINAWAIGRDPASWDEPENFRPERFLNSSIGYKGTDFELIPFGAGRRSCPGIAFAMATNEFVLANIVHKFDWVLPDGAKGEDLDVTESPGVAIRRKCPLLAVPKLYDY